MPLFSIDCPGARGAFCTARILTGTAVKGRRFRAACALAGYDPDNPIWAAEAGFVLDGLATENSVSVPHWMAAVTPIRGWLRPWVALYRKRA